MPVKVHSFVVGPLENNTYIAADSTSRDAVIIDPGFNSEVVYEELVRQQYQLRAIWLTHAHFDHIAGVASLIEKNGQDIPIALHAEDFPLWENEGGARYFGFHFNPGPRPGQILTDGESLMIGNNKFEVHHTPGHTPGHVIFYAPEAGVVFSGDLIFAGSVGRTDLPGGSYEQLIESIQTKILILPPETLILSGHGEQTTVGQEKETNPFL